MIRRRAHQQRVRATLLSISMAVLFLSVVCTPVYAEPFAGSPEVWRAWVKGQVLRVEDNPLTPKVNEAEVIWLDDDYILRPAYVTARELANSKALGDCREENKTCQADLAAAAFVSRTATPSPTISSAKWFAFGAIVVGAFVLGVKAEDWRR